MQAWAGAGQGMWRGGGATRAHVHAGCTQNAAVIMLCAVLWEQLKSLNGEGIMRAGVLNPSAVKTGRAVKGEPSSV